MSKDYPLCKGCGTRMTVENEVTKTHPQESCYIERIKRLEQKVNDLRKENSQLNTLRDLVDKYTITEFKAILNASELLSQDTWALINQGFLAFDDSWRLTLSDHAQWVWNQYRDDKDMLEHLMAEVIEHFGSVDSIPRDIVNAVDNEFWVLMEEE